MSMHEHVKTKSRKPRPRKPQGPSSIVSVDNPQALQSSKAVSFLSGDALRWMNKRRPEASNAAGQVIAPSRALQLRAIFRGLDFDSSGEISLVELKEAVTFVAKSSKPGEDPIFEDPDKICRFFESMDIDGNGTVDFQEFLLGMTTQDSGEKNIDMMRLQQAFFDFANMHRRQVLLDRLTDDTLSETDRYNDMSKLFSIQFVKKEKHILTVEDQIKNAKAEARFNMKEFKEELKKMRSDELKRSRSAAVYFSSEKNDRSDPYSIARAMEKSCLTDSSAKIARATAKVTERLGNFAVSPGPWSYSPPLALVRSQSDIRLQALVEASASKGLSSSASLSMLPPVPMKERILDNALHPMQRQHGQHGHHHHYHH